MKKAFISTPNNGEANEYDLEDNDFNENECSEVIFVEIGNAEVVYLENENFAEAKKISDHFEEPQQWQAYLNVLALKAFEIWFSEQIPKLELNKEECSILQAKPPNLFNAICNLSIGKFKICLIVIDSFSKEVMIPGETIFKATLAAHFYVAIEVLEEQEQALLRGLIRHDQLMKLREQGNLKLQDEFYRIPLSYFDVELNHLLVYLQHLNPGAIVLPTLVHLTQWLQGISERPWSNSEELLTSQQLRRTLFSSEPIEQARLHNFVVDLITYKVVLEVKLSQSENGVIINPKVYPYDKESSRPNTLPANLKLIVLSEGEVVCEVTAKSNDFWIQDEFDAQFGEEFTIQLELEGMKIQEDFIV